MSATRLVLIGLLLLALGSTVPWLLKARAYTFPDAPSGKLACVSYMPRGGAAGVMAEREQIEKDLAQLAHRTQCVRTYAVSNGLDYVPEVARKHGLRVLLGIWIGVNPTTNEQEIAHAIEVAKAHRDVIDAIIVGNEVLLRREQNAEVLREMLGRVHAATNIPVTYADVWEFWLKNPQLVEAASFVTIHILPYWEDEPVGVEETLQHIDRIYAKVQQEFPDKRILIGETGWPSAGRQREGAAPTLVNQARFFREFIAYAAQRNLPYNFIEAYDQPWKKKLEGTVGGYWGIYAVQGHEKFPLTGVVREDPTWWRGLVAAALLCVAMILLARLFVGARSRQATMVWALGGFAAGALVLLQWNYLWQVNRNAREWLAMSAWAISGLVVYFTMLQRLSQRLAQARSGEWRALSPNTYAGTSPVPERKSAGLPAEVSPGACPGLDPETGEGKGAAAQPSTPVWTMRAYKVFFLLFLLGVAYVDLGLSFDARYRGFPTVFVVLPVTALLLHILVTALRRAVADPPSVEETLLLCWLPIASVWIAVHEGAANWPALNWCVWSALPALAFGALQYVKAREQQGAGQHADRR